MTLEIKIMDSKYLKENFLLCGWYKKDGVCRRGQDALDVVKSKNKIIDELVKALEYAENKTYILKNSKKAVFPLFKRDLLKMDTRIKEALKKARGK